MKVAFCGASGTGKNNFPPKKRRVIRRRTAPGATHTHRIVIYRDKDRETIERIVEITPERLVSKKFSAHTQEVFDIMLDLVDKGRVVTLVQVPS
jgi:hypothetical protein